MSEFLARLEELDKAATPGPWEVGDPYHLAGVLDGDSKWVKEHGHGKCVLCPRGELVLEGRFDINGQRMPAHLHRLDDDDYINGHAIVAFDGSNEPHQVAGNYDYEIGGIVNPDDSPLIVHLRNHVPEIIALVKAARKYRDHLNSPYPHTRLLAALEALDK